MKIVFMGTSDFAVPTLEKILQTDHNVVGIVTKPDRPHGRGGKTIPTPVKAVAGENNIPCLEVKRIKEPAAIRAVEDLCPDLIIVASFGEIIPSELIHFPTFECINLHPSLLPKYRGPAPMQRAIMNGAKTTGVTTMFMDEKLDTGDIILQREILIPDDMDYGNLSKLLAVQGADLMMATIDLIVHRNVVRKPQDDEYATYAPMITAADQYISWLLPAAVINNQIRALSPAPGAFASFQQKFFKIYSARVVNNDEIGRPGEVKAITKTGLEIYTGTGVLELLEVQREGKKRMPCSSFLKGFKISPGEVLDT